MAGAVGLVDGGPALIDAETEVKARGGHEGEAAGKATGAAGEARDHALSLIAQPRAIGFAPAMMGQRSAAEGSQPRIVGIAERHDGGCRRRLRTGLVAEPQQEAAAFVERHRLHCRMDRADQFQQDRVGDLVGRGVRRRRLKVVLEVGLIVDVGVDILASDGNECRIGLVRSDEDGPGANGRTVRNCQIRVAGVDELIGRSPGLRREEYLTGKRAGHRAVAHEDGRAGGRGTSRQRRPRLGNGDEGAAGGQRHGFGMGGAAGLTEQGVDRNRAWRFRCDLVKRCRALMNARSRDHSGAQHPRGIGHGVRQIDPDVSLMIGGRGRATRGTGRGDAISGDAIEGRR